ncbi:MAG TPA: MOSC domain-containing protein, partial [Pseudolabrys sp.]
VAGWPAWHEFDLLGRECAIGKSARVKVIKRIQRCAATDVDPNTGIRDLTIPRTLTQTFGHADCGVYAEVVAAGDIAVGDALRL